MCLGMTGVVKATSDDDGVPMALVDAGAAGVIQVCLLTCPEAAAGDTVLIHSGYVLQIVEETQS